MRVIQQEEREEQTAPSGRGGPSAHQVWSAVLGGVIGAVVSGVAVVLLLRSAPPTGGAPPSAPTVAALQAAAAQATTVAIALSNATATARARPTATPTPVPVADPSRPLTLPGCGIVGRFEVCVAPAGRMLPPTVAGSSSAPAPGHEYALFRVAFRNLSGEEWGFDPGDLELVDGNGVVRRREPYLTGNENARLRDGRLSGGGRVEGLLSYVVPQGDAAYSLRYRVYEPFDSGDGVRARWAASPPARG